MKAFFRITLLLSLFLVAGTAQASRVAVRRPAVPPQTELPGQGPGEAPVKAVPRSGHQAKPRRLNDHGQPTDRQAAR
ncbi:hypothetical protein, partial [Hymenobacter daeguensis]